MNFFETSSSSSSSLNQHTNRFLKLLILTAILLDAAVLGDRTRHRKQDLYSATLEKNSFEGGSSSSNSKTSFHSCPNCLYKTNKERDMKIESDHIRLEAIKREILSKLGLRHKPNVTHALPRDLIEKTYRTITGERQDDNLRARNSGARSANYDTVDVDDYYGKTSEIISFAEQGEYSLRENKIDYVIRARYNTPCYSTSVLRNYRRANTNSLNVKLVLTWTYKLIRITTTLSWSIM